MIEPGPRMEQTVVLNNEQTEHRGVLIIDGDDFCRGFIKEIIALQGFPVETATDIGQALGKLNAQRFELIIVDVSESTNTGETLAKLRAAAPDSAVVITTAEPRVEDAVESLKNGAEDYLAKPLDGDTLKDSAIKAIKKSAKPRINPVLIEVSQHIPAEFRPISVINQTESSVIVLVERKNKYFAMKIMNRNDTVCDQGRLARFSREAKLMTSVSHPNIVKVIEYHCGADETPFILMEYVTGKSMTEEFINKLEIEERIELVGKIAAALWELHKRGIVHRDLKPGNILTTESGEPKLTDFGIAKIKDSSLTITKEILGSISYMAPESFKSSKESDFKSDIFSFGILAYEILTGEKPFKGDDVNQVMHAIQTGKPLRPSAVMPSIPRYVEDVLAKMMEKKPEKRYVNMAQAALDLGPPRTPGRVK